MPRRRKRPNEPIAPTQIPGGSIDPKLPDDIELPPEEARLEADEDAHVETEEELQARESEKAFDQAITRIPPG